MEVYHRMTKELLKPFKMQVISKYTHLSQLNLFKGFPLDQQQQCTDGHLLL